MGRHWLKAFSLFFALILWAYVVSTLPQNFTKNVPLEFLLPDDISLVSSSAREVTISMRGARAFLYQLKNQLLHLPVDLRQFRGPFDFQVEIPLGTQMIPHPSGVDLKLLRPESIRVQLSKKGKKKLALRPSLAGEFAKGLVLEKIKVTPSEIIVSGPEKEIEQLQFVPLEVLNREQLADQGSVQLNSTLDPQVFQFSNPGPFKVEYKLRAKAANVTLKKIKIRFVSSRQVVNSSEKFASLEVMASEKNRTFKKDEVQVYAEVNNDKPGTYSIELRAELPEDVHLVEVFPRKISVTVK